jgi:hypothetical protein
MLQNQGAERSANFAGKISFSTRGYYPIDGFQKKEVGSFEVLLLRQKAFERE